MTLPDGSVNPSPSQEENAHLQGNAALSDGEQSDPLKASAAHLKLFEGLKAQSLRDQAKEMAYYEEEMRKTQHKEADQLAHHGYSDNIGPRESAEHDVHGKAWKDMVRRQHLEALARREDQIYETLREGLQDLARNEYLHMHTHLQDLKDLARREEQIMDARREELKDLAREDKLVIQARREALMALARREDHEGPHQE